MSAIISSKFRLENLKAFNASVEADNFYLFISKPLPWSDESSPDTPIDSDEALRAIWNEAIAAKRITTDDIRQGIFLRVWTSGKFYDRYRSDYDGTVSGVDIDTGSPTTPANLFDTNFYVVDDVTLNVYKCLSNISLTTGLPIASINKPSGTSSSVIVTGDGYRWKYMFTVPSGDAANFNTPSFIPAPAIGTSTLVDGGIYTYVVETDGTGYTSTPTATVFGDGTGATATVNVSGNQVKSVVVNAPGSGYKNAKVVISGGGGSGATVKPMISPQGGHGSAPADELGGIYVLIAQQLQAEEVNSKFTVSNDYRQLGLIKNPTRNISPAGQVGVEADASGNPTTHIRGSSTTFTTQVVVGDVIKINNTADGTVIYLKVASIASDISAFAESVPAPGSLDLTTFGGSVVGYDYEVIVSDETVDLTSRLLFTGALSGTGTFAADASITGGTSGAVAKSVDFNTSTHVGRYILDYTVNANIVNFANNETVSDGVGQSGTTAASNAVTAPDATPYSGEIIYFENRRAINRSADQSEAIRIVIEF